MKIGTTIAFEAAHRQMLDEGKCKNLHGHNWEVYLELTGQPIGGCNYLVDFKTLKAQFDQFDHACILQVGDPLIECLSAQYMKLLVVDDSPSCETLCDVFAEMILKEYKNIEVVEISVWENSKSYASGVYRQIDCEQMTLMGVVDEG